MNGVFQGLKVLDLSSGIAGPIATMLLADSGALVTKIERPGGDQFRDFSGTRVWGRGKRSAILDLKTEEDRAVFFRLAAEADVVVESFAPGKSAALGVNYDKLARLNPRLVHLSITGYGEDGKHSGRPGIDALVAARTGLMWEHRGRVGGSLSLISGGVGMLPGVEPPSQDCWLGPERKGPMFGGVPWTSIATAYHASLAITAALRAREKNGRGQHVHTSLMQGVLGNTVMAWQRAENYEAPWYQSWIVDPRAPKAIFRSADNRWMHQWNVLPGFILGTAAGTESHDVQRANNFWEVTAPKEAAMRIGLEPEDMVILHHYNNDFTEAMAKLTADEWTQAGVKVGVPIQPIRSPEEALLDEAFLADGCVVEIDDPEVGLIRQVGSVIRLSAFPTDAEGPPPTPAPLLGQHTDQVRAEAAQAEAPAHSPDAGIPTTDKNPPLAGIKVLDLGLAIAGPFSTQLLADLGAEVIKINTAVDGFWFASHLAMSCNRGKKSLSIDLKTKQGMEILSRLVEDADVVQHNMRYDAAVRLGVDYESLKAINPDLIYSHSRGFERGERDGLPANDQTGAALAGTEWMDGGADFGGRPLWSIASAGDTGTGYLSAIGIVQAIYHRDRTGEGQFVDTSIMYAQLLNASMTWVSPYGDSAADRPRLDANALGWNALYGIYKTSDEWLCLASLDDDSWSELILVLGLDEMSTDERFATKTARYQNDSELRSILELSFAKRPASEWQKLLDESLVPSEIVSWDFALDIFNDEEFRERQWVTSYEHPRVGTLDQFGLVMDFAETPGKIAGPPPMVGEHTGEILGGLGFDDDQIAALIAERIVFDVSTVLTP